MAKTVEILGQTFQLYIYNGERGYVREDCWKCGGSGYLPYYLHVFNGECFACRATGGVYLTVEQMTKRIKGREYRAKSAARKRDAKETKRLADLAAFAEANPELAFMATDVVHQDDTGRPSTSPPRIDMAVRLQRYGSISAKQIDFAKRLMVEAQEKQERWAAEKAMAAPAPAGRQVVEGKIIKVVHSWATFGYHERSVYRITVKTDAGWVCNGNAPSTFAGVEGLEGDFEDRIKGRTVRFTATLEPKEDDPTFAFFKRPAKGELVLDEADPIDLQDAANGDFTPGV